METKTPLHRFAGATAVEARREVGRLLREATGLLEGSDLPGASEKLEEARFRILALRESSMQGKRTLSLERESRQSERRGREPEG